MQTHITQRRRRTACSLPHPIMHKRLDLVGMRDPYQLTQVGP